MEIDGTVFELSLRKVLALLAYLAVTGQRHSRDALAELLFPGTDRDNARAGIRRSLSILRGTIGTERLGGDHAGAWFEPGDDTVVDVREFHSRLAAGADAPATERLEKAVGLYRGDFLSGFYLRDCPGFEEWQLGEAESLRQEQAAALRRLAEIHGGAGRTAQAIEFARKLLALDPLEETSHRTLMRLYAQDGRRSEALRQYAQCRASLRRELGQDPDEETEALRGAITSRRLAAERPGSGRRADAPRRARASPSTGRTCASGVVVLETDPRSPAAGAYPTVEAAVSAALAFRGASASCEYRMAMHADARESVDAVQEEVCGPAVLTLAAAHPGQILLTSAAAERVAVERPCGFGVYSLGAHRLMDLGPPREVFQLVHPEVQQVFPPLRTLDSIPNNLRIQPTPSGENIVVTGERAASLDGDRGAFLVGVAVNGDVSRSAVAAIPAFRCVLSYPCGNE